MIRDKLKIEIPDIDISNPCEQYKSAKRLEKNIPKFNLVKRSVYQKGQYRETYRFTEKLQ